MNKKILIAIPARYSSSRLPGKPLIKLNGKEMIYRVYENARRVKIKYPRGMVDIAVGTEDQRIVDFCSKNEINAFMTSKECRTGTDRVKEIMDIMNKDYDFIINLQGDNPLAAPWHIKEMIDIYLEEDDADVVTPCILLSWEALDKLRKNKKTTPFSGTTAIIHPKTSQAIWFSKHIIPAIRKESLLRKETKMSPIHRHVGLYGYKKHVLENIANLEESDYESGNLEGLEQLRFILNGYKVRVIKIDYEGYEEISSSSGVDNQEDVLRVESLLNKYGEYEW
jgi:3-deoxy-manno-octulosonate cytidylyltransferase (CMP-KDO synthetase)